MLWTSQNILDFQKFCVCCFCCCFFLLGSLLRTLDLAVLEELLLGLSFLQNFLNDSKMLSGLLECFASVEFCLFFLSNILQRVLEHFSPSLFHLILKQIFAVSYCLLSPWCNFCCKFPIICLNFGLKFSIKILIPYLS